MSLGSVPYNGGGINPIPWTGQQIVAVCLFPFALFEFSYAIAFYLRRRRRPIKGRFPTLVLAVDTVIWGWTPILCWKMIDQPDWPCIINAWDSILCCNVLALLYTSRAWLLLVDHNKNTLKKLIGEARVRTELMPITQKAEIHLAKDWKDRIKLQLMYASPKFVATVLTCVGVVFILPVFFMSINAGPPGDFFGSYGCNIEPANALLAAELVVYVILFIGFSLLFRDKLEDNFGVKYELRLSGYIVAGCIIPFAMFSIVSSLKVINVEVLRVTAVIPIVTMATLFMVNTVHPVHQSNYLRQFYMKRTASFIMEQATEMKLVITSQEGFIAFSSFLAKEFAVENILFWDEVRNFRQWATTEEGHTAQEVLDKAQELFDKYVQEGSIAQVNLTYGVAESIRGKISRCKENIELVSTLPLGVVFVEAEKAVFNLMQQDPYVRFKQSEEFISIKPMVQKIKDEYASSHPGSMILNRRISHLSQSNDSYETSDSSLAIRLDTIGEE